MAINLTRQDLQRPDSKPILSPEGVIHLQIEQRIVYAHKNGVNIVRVSVSKHQSEYVQTTLTANGFTVSSTNLPFESPFIELIISW